MKKTKIKSDKDVSMPLNRYLAHAGLCSRRQAVVYIKNGDIKVNNTLVREPGFRVTDNDIIHFKNKHLRVEKKVYVLINKPQGYVTTLSDEKGRLTVIDLIKPKIKQRVYPVGRLDRFTTGLLLLTNDGDLAQKLAHPSYEVKKVYNVLLNSLIKKQDLEKIKKGITLKDGFIRVDKIICMFGKNRNNIKIELHSGKNRIVRRIFNHLGYKVIKLDRVNYAGLTKRGIPLGRWRELSLYEIDSLHRLGEVKKRQSKIKKTGK